MAKKIDCDEKLYREISADWEGSIFSIMVRVGDNLTDEEKKECKIFCDCVLEMETEDVIDGYGEEDGELPADNPVKYLQDYMNDGLEEDDPDWVKLEL